jgi:hypothetical protein
MQNQRGIKNLALLGVLVVGLAVAAGCSPALGANAANGGLGGTSGGSGGSNPLLAPRNMSVGTPDPGGDQPVVVSATIQALGENSVTINGVRYTVTDPSQLAGLAVGDTVTVTLETKPGGTLVVADITLGSPTGSGDNQGEDQSTEGATPEATEANGDNNNVGDQGATPEATEANGDNNNVGEQGGTAEPTEVNGDNNNVGEQGGSTGGGDGGGEDGGSDGGGSDGGSPTGSGGD